MVHGRDTIKSRHLLQSGKTIQLAFCLTYSISMNIHQFRVFLSSFASFAFHLRFESCQGDMLRSQVALYVCMHLKCDMPLAGGNAVLGGAGGDGGDFNGNFANGGDFNSGDFSGNGDVAIGDNGNGGAGGNAYGGESAHDAFFTAALSCYHAFQGSTYYCYTAILPCLGILSCALLDPSEVMLLANF